MGLRHYIKSKRWLVLVVASIPLFIIGLATSILIFFDSSVVEAAFLCFTPICFTGLGVFLLVSGIQERKCQRISSRTRYNLCLDCGYDLRGNVTGKCPECGTAIANDIQL